MSRCTQKQPANCYQAKAVQSSISLLPEEDRPICVLVLNDTGKDIEVVVERIPGNDTRFRVQGEPGETISSLKFYSAEPGVNVVNVKVNGRTISSRTFNF